MNGEITIVIPWVPPREANPNNHTNSERTKIRYRKQGAVAAGYPMNSAFNAFMFQQPGNGYSSYLFDGPVVLDIIIRWGYRQRSWDRDNIVTAMKYTQDALQTFGIVRNDKDIIIGDIVQERATQQPETVFVLRPVAAER